MKKKVAFVLSLVTSLLLLVACSSVDGTYVYQGSMPFMEEVTVTIQIKGDKGQVHTKGKTIGFLTEGQQTEHTYEMKVNQKEKTFELSSMKLGYEIKGGELTITSDSTGILAGKSFKKK